jgi:hypothetical protein
MRFEATLPGNPHSLTIRQHTFPRLSISRFVGTDGKVSAILLNSGKAVRLFPDHSIFYTKRVWDERAEKGYMKSIEDDFQELADRVVAGQSHVEGRDCTTAAKFFALWFWRHGSNQNAPPDHAINGVVDESLSKDQQEAVEKKWGAFLLPGSRLPGRMVSGWLIQTRINDIVLRLENSRWGIVRATGGEFIVPDTFAGRAILPVSPTLCLACGIRDMTISDVDLSKINSLARQSAKRYLFARDIDLCP